MKRFFIKLLIAFSILFAVVVAAMVYEGFHASKVMEEGFLTGYVTPETWGKLTVGMGKEEVEELLGRPMHTRSYSTKVETAAGSEEVRKQWWEYNYADKLSRSGEPPHRAFVVWFDDSDRAYSFRQPVAAPEKKKAPGAAKAGDEKKKPPGKEKPAGKQRPPAKKVNQ